MPIPSPLQPQHAHTAEPTSPSHPLYDAMSMVDLLQQAFQQPQQTIQVFSSAMPQLLGRPAFEFKQLHGSEAISELYAYHITLQTPDIGIGYGIDESVTANLNHKALVGKEFSLQIELDGGDSRCLAGIVTQARYVRSENRRSLYEIVLQPWLTLATLRSDYKIFQQQSALDIIRDTLSAYPYPLEIETSYAYPALTYQVQYGETDYQLVSRLAAQWGLYYYFRHQAARDGPGSHTLILTDNPGSHQVNPGSAYQTVPYYPTGHKPDHEYLQHYSHTEQLQSGQWTTLDYDFTQVKAQLTHTSRMPRNTAHAQLERIDWPGDYDKTLYDEAVAQHLTDVRMQAEGMQGHRGYGEGELRGMVTGHTFTLVGHPHQASNQDYLITRTVLDIQERPPSSLSANSQPYRFNCQLDTIPATHQYRQEWQRDALGRPLKPRVSGSETAIVTGPAGESLHLDAYGRVKVQFHWDRYGKHDENSSCWIRVSEAWSGGEMGSNTPPRIGQEVIISYLHGDPDRPLIVGRVNNQFNHPPWLQPSQGAVSGIRSRELNADYGNSPSGRSNHLLFDDTHQQLQVQLKSDTADSQLSLGHIVRIDQHSGRQDYRGSGFELRSDHHGSVRAKQGLYLSTHAREQAQGHHTDLSETSQQLHSANSQHHTLTQAAYHAQALDNTDQQQLQQALQQQQQQIQGKAGTDQGFPELSQPHLVLSGAAGIASTTPHNTHISSGEHTALTSGGLLSLNSGKNLLASALGGLRLFAKALGMRLIAYSGDIEIKALQNNMQLWAKLHIEETANTIRIYADKTLDLQGGNSGITLSNGQIKIYSETLQSHAPISINPAQSLGLSPRGTPAVAVHDERFEM
ncbi:type VI secretion system tip protein VgrG, partial [Neisseriaceae bacterium TC5R-5]|nr:type VI secretion system tip protein VgrG [Neisseriaceae bacterium TC5R-5]